MEYRRLGRAGLKVSVLGFGTWLTFAEQADRSEAIAMLEVARNHGVIFFDTAEGYGRGQAVELLGSALDQLAWDRASYVLSTKLYAGTRNIVNMRQTLNRKYLMQAIGESLERLRTSYVDLLFCHRPDPHTALEETVWAMSDIVASGKAIYWGTSEWPPELIRAAVEFADRYRLRKPVVEQLEYSLLQRSKFEQVYAGLNRELGIGLTTWSPLASGLLTGKYKDGAPSDSRASLPGYAWLKDWLLDADRNHRVAKFGALAHTLGATPAQLAIAWCTLNPTVSSVICGAHTAQQLRENIRAIELAPHLSPALVAQIDQIFPA